MTTCSHGIPFEEKCPHCLAEGLAREAARGSGRPPDSLGCRGDAVIGPVMTTDPQGPFNRVMATTVRRAVGLCARVVTLVAVAVLGPVSVQADTWDEPINIPGQRFAMLGSYQNQGVLDKETGLVWERSPSTSTYIWNDAHVACNFKTVGRRMGWRLPTIQELASLIDTTVPSPGPTLPAGHPFSNVQSESSPGTHVPLYWSATSHINSTAWIASFRIGMVEVVGKGASSYAWCVRGGQGVDPQ